MVAIIGTLAAIAVPNFLEARTRSKIARVLAEMRAVQTGLEIYAVDERQYPPNLLDEIGRTNVMNMTTGKMPFVPYTLTTPVAYMTVVPLDHFNPKIMKDHVHSYMYYNAANTPDDANRRAYRAAVEGLAAANADALRAPKWFLVSSGPDLELGTMARQVELRGDLPIYSIMVGAMSEGMGRVPVQYDPTNGTVSAGDIVRIGP